MPRRGVMSKSGVRWDGDRTIAKEVATEPIATFFIQQVFISYPFYTY